MTVPLYLASHGLDKAISEVESAHPLLIHLKSQMVGSYRNINNQTPHISQPLSRNVMHHLKRFQNRRAMKQIFRKPKSVFVIEKRGCFLEDLLIHPQQSCIGV